MTPLPSGASRGEKVRPDATVPAWLWVVLWLIAAIAVIVLAGALV